MRRRIRILEAARQCIQQGGAESLSLKAIAKMAEVSVATLYNLFGSKEGILVTLLVQTIESFRERFHSSDIQAGLSSDRGGQVDSLSEIAIEEFVADEYFYRELLKSLQQMEVRIHLNGLVGLCVDLGEPIIRRMIASGDLLDVVSPRVLSHQLFMNFVHAVQLWSSGVSSSDQFRTQVAHSQCLLLAGIASEAYRAKLHERLRELDREMLDFSDQQPVPPTELIETGIPVSSNAPIAQGVL